MIHPRNFAIGPRMAPEYAVNSMADIKTSIMEPDHILPLKKDYTEEFSIKQVNRLSQHHTSVLPPDHTGNRKDNMDTLLI